MISRFRVFFFFYQNSHSETFFRISRANIRIGKTRGQVMNSNIRFFFTRYDWRRPASGGCPAAASFYRGVSVRGPPRLPSNGIDTASRSLTATSCCIRNGNGNGILGNVPKSPNMTSELYVFASGRHKHTTERSSQELCLQASTFPRKGGRSLETEISLQIIDDDDENDMILRSISTMKIFV